MKKIDQEKKEIREILKTNECVISLGGGAFIDKSLRKSILKNCISVWLDLDIKTLSNRTKWNQKRPLVKKNNNFDNFTILIAQKQLTRFREMRGLATKCLMFLQF